MMNSGRGRRRRRSHPLSTLAEESESNPPKPKIDRKSDSEIELMIKIPMEDRRENDIIMELDKEPEMEMIPQREKEDEEKPQVVQESTPLPIIETVTATPSRETRSTRKGKSFVELELQAERSKYSELEGRMRECCQALVAAKKRNHEMEKTHNEQLAQICNKRDFDLANLRKINESLELMVKTARNELEKAQENHMRETKFFQFKETNYQSQVKDAQLLKDNVVAANLYLQAQVKTLQGQAKEASLARQDFLKHVKMLEEAYKEKIENMSTHCKNLEELMNEKVNTIRADHAELQHKFQCLKKRREQELVEHQRALDAIKGLEDSLIIFREQNVNFVDEFKKMQAKIKEILSEKKQLQTELASTQEKLAKLDEEMKKVLEAKDSLQAELNAECKTLSATIQDKEKEMETLKKEITTFRLNQEKMMKIKDSKINLLQTELQSVKTDNENSMKKFEEDFGSLAVELGSKTQELQHLEEVVQNRESEIDGYRLQIERLTAFINQQNQETKHLRDKVREKNTTDDKLRLEYETMKIQLNKQNLEMRQLINEVVTVKDENIKLTASRDEIFEKYNFYKNRFDEIASRSASSDSENVSSDDFQKNLELYKLKADLEEKQKQIEELKRAISLIGTPTTDSKKRRYFDENELHNATSVN